MFSLFFSVLPRYWGVNLCMWTNNNSPNSGWSPRFLSRSRLGANVRSVCSRYMRIWRYFYSALSYTSILLLTILLVERWTVPKVFFMPHCIRKNLGSLSWAVRDVFLWSFSMTLTFQQPLISCITWCKSDRFIFMRLYSTTFSTTR